MTYPLKRHIIDNHVFSSLTTIQKNHDNNQYDFWLLYFPPPNLFLNVVIFFSFFIFVNAPFSFFLSFFFCYIFCQKIKLMICNESTYWSKNAEAAEIGEILEQYGVEPHEYGPVVDALRRNPQAWLDFMMKWVVYSLRIQKPLPPYYIFLQMHLHQNQLLN